MEIYVKYVPGSIANKRYFQYTAIDVAGMWRHLISYVKYQGLTPLLLCNGSYKREDLSSGQMHGLDQFCAPHNIVRYLIDPGKPTQNGTVERSHREDQEKFYQKNTFKNPRDLERKIRVWNTYYNNLEHCGLMGKTPNELLADYKLIKPPYVLA